jgi:hypothetical protein
LYASTNIIKVIKSRMMRRAEDTTRMGDKRNRYNVPVGKPRRRWKDNIRMDMREVGWEGMDWMHLIQDRDQWRAVVNTVMKLRVL